MLIYTMLTTFSIMLLIPLFGMLPIDHETFMFFVILLVSIKEGSYLIWISTWSQMMSRFFPSMMLGRIYSWSYFLGHCMLVLSSQIYPRGLTFFMTNSFIVRYLSRCRYIVFFFLLGAPYLIGVWLTYRIKLKAREMDNIKI